MSGFFGGGGGTATASGSGTENTFSKFNASGELVDSDLVESSNALTVPDDYQIGRDANQYIQFNDTADVIVIRSASFNLHQISNSSHIFQTTGTYTFQIGATDTFKVDGDSTSGNTRMLIYDVDNATLERVSVGAADSGGVGFKLLRIPN